MATQQDLAAYVASVRGLYIDVDRVFGAQCWDQMSHYMQWYGVPAWPTYTNAGGTYPHAGYACNVFHNAASAGLTNYFDVIPAGATPRAGDIAFWEYGTAYYPWSHVATVLEVTHGGRMLRCLTQNPGAVQIADLIINGLIGYLRPRALTVGNVDVSRTPGLSASQKIFASRRRRKRGTMFIHLEGTQQYAVFTPGVKGSWTEAMFTQNSANALASQYGNAATVGIDFWNAQKKKHA